MADNFSSSTFISKLVNGDLDAMQSIIKKYTTHLVKAGLGLGLSKEGCEEVAHSTWETFF